MSTLHHRLILCLGLLLLVGACGVTDQPTARQAVPGTPPAGTPGPTDPAAPADAAGLRVSAPTFTTFTPPPYPPPALTGTAARLETEVVLAVTTSASTPTPEPLRTPVAQGPLLRQVWPTAPRTAPPTRFLYYSTVTDNRDTFWRVNLRNLQQRHLLLDQEASRRAQMPLVGEVAPGGHWIAYLHEQYNGYALHVVRRNGQQDQIIAADGLAQGYAPCANGIAWSPDGRMLAFEQDGEPQQEFDNVLWVTDLHPQHPPQPVAAIGWPEFIHWYDATRVLVVTTVDYQRPRQIELIDVITGARESIGELPVIGHLTCAQVAPDRQHLLMATEYTTYVFHLTTRQWTTLDIHPNRSVWSVDSTLLLEVPAVGGEPMRLLALDPPGTVTTLTLMQLYTSTTRFYLKGAAPDGQYLVVCVREQTERSLARTLLYDVAADRWDTLAEGLHCLNILGWGPPNG